MKSLSRFDIESCLADQPMGILSAVAQAYLLQGTGEVRMPQASRLEPESDGPAWVAAPGTIGGTRPAAGVTWTSSGTAGRILSSLLILDDPATGLPRAVLDAGAVLEWRVAAASALASVALHDGDPVDVVGLVGAGKANLKVLAILAAAHPECSTVLVYDPVPDRTGAFIRRARAVASGTEVLQAPTLQTVLESSDSLSVTTADDGPLLQLPAPASEGRQIVVQLAPVLDPAALVGVPRVVDDPGAGVDPNGGASVGLGALLAGTARVPDAPRILFTPDPPGALDVALAAEVLRRADASGLGTTLDLVTTEQPSQPFLPGARP